ncbi:MAG: hypothetical protein IKN72_11410 [Clostridia bacterium]|nr:hypothetical protein [Clostridia bacterium]
METMKKSLSVLPAVVLAFGVLSLTARADTNCGVRTVAITESPCTICRTASCSAPAPAPATAAKPVKAVLSGSSKIYSSIISRCLWALFKNKGHRTCFCGRIHY